ncbi:MAG: AI-2E family transporter [Solirubrobacterales bacterium]
MEQSVVSWRLIVKIVLVAAATIAALYLLYQVRNVIELLLIAVFFALAVAPAVNWLDGRRVPRALAILLVYLGIGSAIFGIGLLLVPPLVTGVENLSEDLPGYVDDLRHNEQFRKYDDRYNITEKLKEQATDLPNRLDDAAGTLQDVTVGVFSRIVQLLAILVISFFLLIEGPKMLEFFYAQLPKDRERRLRVIANDVSEAISGYVFGAFTLAFLAGCTTYATLSLLGIPFALPLAILFAFLDLVPLVGATIGAIVVGSVVAFFDFPGDLIIWVIVAVGYQQVENYLIQPFVYGRAVRVHPLVVLIAILIGASLLGILGALVAIPVSASVQIVVRDWWRFRGERLAAETKRSAKPRANPKPRPKTKPKPRPA